MVLRVVTKLQLLVHGCECARVSTTFRLLSKESVVSYFCVSLRSLRPILREAYGFRQRRKGAKNRKAKLGRHQSEIWLVIRGCLL
jgi:hypothetical protein